MTYPQTPRRLSGQTPRPGAPHPGVVVLKPSLALSPSCRAGEQRLGLSNNGTASGGGGWLADRSRHADREGLLVPVAWITGHRVLPGVHPDLPGAPFEGPARIRERDDVRPASRPGPGHNDRVVNRV